MPDAQADTRQTTEPVVETRGEVAWDEEIGGYSSMPVRLLVEPRWRSTWEERWMELYVPGTGRWRRVKKHWEPVLEGLLAGETLAESEDRLAEARPDFNEATRRFIVRKVVRNLERAGMAELVTPDPPAVFDDRYERVSRLGRGGMGVVWLCRDRETDGREVAVKHAWNWKTRFAKAEDSIREEAEMLARFEHPRIMGLVDTFEHEGRFHLVREYLEGRSLTAWCGDEDVDETRRVQATEQVAEVLDDLRGEGWFYFDVSPANFYVDPDAWELTLGDLGVYRPIEDGLEVSSRIGTRRYAAPEMIGGGRASEASHVYALGRLHWHVVMGRIPVSRSSVDAVRRQNRAILELLRDSRASPREVAFFDQATRVDPDERPPRVAEALELLREGPP